MKLTLKDLMGVGIPKNISKLNNKAFTPAAIPNDSVNLYEAIQLILDTSTASINIDALVALTGVPHGDTNLGTFTGDIITDSSSIKSSLQQLEAAIETITGQNSTIAITPTEITLSVGDDDLVFPIENGTNVGLASPGTMQRIASLITLSGLPENSNDLGTFVNSIISDNNTVKNSLQELETATTYLYNITGLPFPSMHLGTFTGSIISDNVSIKTALQELEDSLSSVSVDLGATYVPSSVTITNTGGDDVTINAAVPGGAAGVMTGADKGTLDNVLAAVGSGASIPHMGDVGSLLPMNTSLKVVIPQINDYLIREVHCEDSAVVTMGTVEVGNVLGSTVASMRKTWGFDISSGNTVTFELNPAWGGGASNQHGIRFLFIGKITGSGTVTFDATGYNLYVFENGSVTTAPEPGSTYSVTTPGQYYRFEVVLINNEFFLTNWI